jgi:hypothetical protein
MQEAYVDSVHGGKVTVVCRRLALRRRLRELGGRTRMFRPSSIVFSAPTPEALAAVLMALRDAGLPFAGGSGGWPPSAVFEDLREKGEVHGSYVEILWTGPTDAKRRER